MTLAPEPGTAATTAREPRDEGGDDDGRDDERNEAAPRPGALRDRDRVRHLRVGRVALRGRGVLVEEQRVRAVARLVLVDDDVTDAGEREGLGRGQHAAGGREGGPHRSRVGVSLRRIGLARRA